MQSINPTRQWVLFPQPGRLEMRRLIRLIVVASLCIASACAAADPFTIATGKLDNDPDSLWPNANSNSQGAASALVGLDTGNHALTATIAYDNLNNPVTSVTIGRVNGNVIEVMTAALGVRDSPDIKMAVTDGSTASTAFWDQGFLSDKTVQQAQDLLDAALKAGQAYLSVNTAITNEIRGPLALYAIQPPERALKLDAVLRNLRLGKADLWCSKDLDLGRCVIPVYAYQLPNGACQTFVPFKEVHVAQKKKTRLVWLLVNSNVNDAHEYRFNPGKGVVLLPNDSTSPPTTNDPALDFNGPDDDGADSRRFKWNSVHGRLNTFGFPYAIVAQMRDPGGGQPLQCLPADPTVTNE
jgi:hypothetical protein